eukprot:g4239.t1
MSDKRGRQRDGGGGGSSSGSKKSKKGPRVMDASGQTVEERRKLRLEQRNLKNQIIEQQADLGDLNKSTCRDLTEQNGKLFDKTRFPREAVTDGENMKLIAEGSAAQADKANTGVVGVDLEEFLQRVKKIYSQKHGNAGDFNWSKWGGDVSRVYLATPTGGDFMMGPLDKPAKERKVAQRRQKLVDDAEEERPEVEVGKGKKAKQNKDQTQARISDMKKNELNESDNVGKNRDMFEVLVNPKSFTQTVENMFDFSFFVKSGEAHTSIDEDTKLPLAKFENIESAAEGASSEARTHKQWLMSFTKADFNELVELYDMKEPYIKHRSEGPKSDYYDPLKHGNRESNRQ